EGRAAAGWRGGNFGKQAVGVKAAEEASHLSRLLARVGSEGNGGARELESQAPVGAAVKRMLATEECLDGMRSWRESGLKGRTALPLGLESVAVKRSSARIA